jgi:agmatinase
MGAVPVLIGGDDSVPIPMIAALAGTGATYTILQIDAHIDWRDEVDGETMGLSSTMRRASEMAHIGRIIQVGQRGIGSARPGDYQAARDWGVQFVPAGEIARNGLQRAIDLIPTGADVIICFDVDALDPSTMPAAIGRTAGGLSYWQVLDLISAVAAKARIAAFDLVEMMPQRDIDGIGALTAAQILAATLGLICRQRLTGNSEAPA